MVVVLAVGVVVSIIRVWLRDNEKKVKCFTRTDQRRRLTDSNLSFI